jgi:hypothetical protein
VKQRLSLDAESNIPCAISDSACQSTLLQQNQSLTDSPTASEASVMNSELVAGDIGGSRHVKVEEELHRLKKALRMDCRG